MAKVRMLGGMAGAALLLLGPAAAQDSEVAFTATLHGAQQVPPVETAATAMAEFALTPDGEALLFRLRVDGLDGATAAHIHLGPIGETGSAVALLFDAAIAPGQPRPGVLAEGVIKSDDLVGAMGAARLDALIAEMEAGRAYVDVHTAEHPDGAIRGQILRGSEI